MNCSRALLLFGLLLPPLLPGMVAAEAASTDGSPRRALANELEQFDNSTHWIELSEPQYHFAVYPTNHSAVGGTAEYWIRHDNRSHLHGSANCCEELQLFEPKPPGIYQVEFRGRGQFAFLETLLTTRFSAPTSSENLSVEERTAFVSPRRAKENHLCLDSNVPFDADVWSTSFKIDEPVAELHVVDQFRNVQRVYGVYDTRDPHYMFVRMSLPGWLNVTESLGDCRAESALSSPETPPDPPDDGGAFPGSSSSSASSLRRWCSLSFGPAVPHEAPRMPRGFD